MLHLLFALTIAVAAPSWLPASEEEISFDDIIRKPRGLSRNKPTTLRERIAYLNLDSFIPEDRSWSTHSQYEWLCKSIRIQADPAPQDRRDRVFKMLSTTPYATTSIMQDSTTWQDLDIFAGKKPEENYVGNILCRAKTDLGKAQFMYLLGANTADHEEIMRRQEIIKTLRDNQQLRDTFTAQLEAYAPFEDLFLCHWQQHEDYLQEITKNYLFVDPLLKMTNDSTAAIWTKFAKDFVNKIRYIASDVDNLCALTLFLTSRLIDTSAPQAQGYANRATGHHQYDIFWRNAWQYSPEAIKYGITALSLYFIWSSIERSIEYCVDSLMFEEIIHYKLINVSQALRAMQKIAILIEHNEELLNRLPELKPLINLFATTKEQNPQLHELLNLLLSDTFAADAGNSLFFDRVKVLVGYVAMHTLKDELLPAIQAFGLLDAYTGIANLIEEAPDRFCFAQLETADTPHLYLEDFINPLVPADKVITNSIELGTRPALSGVAPQRSLDHPEPVEGSRNCIVTGPNAGGKSTLVKAIGINVLLAQSLGIALARRCVLTPFNFVATYLNITDDINAGNSRFKSEVLRTQELINAMLNLPAGQHGLLIFDEVFNGTTPAEGSAAAYAVAEFLGKIPNSIAIIATHFEQLTKLETDVKSGYKNYKVSVKINDDGSLTYPFKLEAGISNQHIALDMLRNEGYSGAIVTRTASLLGRA